MSYIPSVYDHSAHRTIARRYTVLEPLDIQALTTPSAIGSQPSVSSGTSTSIPSSSSASTTNGSNSSVSTTRGSPLSAGQSLQTLAPPNDPSSASPPSPSSGSPSSNNSQSSGSPGTAASNHSRSKTLVVATVSIGALLGLAIASLLFFLLNRRCRKRRDGSSLSPYPVDPTLPPQLPTGKGAWSDSPSTSSRPDHEEHPESSSSLNHAELFARFIASALADNDDSATAPPPYQPRRTSRPPPI